MMLTLKLLHDHTNTNCIRKVFTFKNIKTCIQYSTSIYIRMESETHNWKLQMVSPLVGGGESQRPLFQYAPVLHLA